MQQDEPEAERPGAAPGINRSKASTEERLKRALRENLKRRKSQARKRDETAAASSNPGRASPHPGSAKKPGE